MKENSLEDLVKIWKMIPTKNAESNSILDYHAINKFLEIFQLGEFCYVIFNTETADFDYIDSEVYNILGIPSYEFSLQNVLKKIHPNDLDYFLSYEKKQLRFLII